MAGMQCGKVIHLTVEAAELHRDSLEERYGKPPNIYPCNTCSTDNLTIYHVGYGFDGSKLSKRARRHRKQAGSRQRRRKRNGA